METIKDSARFDSLQGRLLEEITREIMDKLIELGVSSEQLQRTTEDLAFSIAAIVDGSRVMELDGKVVRPVLTFAADDNAEQLIDEGGSWMHEYAIGTAEQMVQEYLDQND